MLSCFALLACVNNSPGRIDALSGGLCRASDLGSVHERLSPYVAAGFRALCERARLKAAKPRAAPARRRRP